MIYITHKHKKLIYTSIISVDRSRNSWPVVDEDKSAESRYSSAILKVDGMVAAADGMVAV